MPRYNWFVLGRYFEQTDSTQTNTFSGPTTISGALTASGGVTGDVTGDLTGDVTGNVTGDVTGQITTAPVDATAATLTVTAALHRSGVVTLNRAAGIAVTLPAAAGTGDVYRFFIGTTVTSNNTTIKVDAAAATMSGVCLCANDTDNSASLFETAADSDTITFNGTTTGGILGDFVELHDVASNKWFVRVTMSATGTEATPFSATVS